MITILHLYPRELSINGDVGNVMALSRRAQWRGMPARVINHNVGSDLPKRAEVVHIGSGPVSAQDLVKDDLARIAPELVEWSRTGVPFLAIAGGWQLLSESLTGLDGTTSAGAGVFPTSARLTDTRTVREVWNDDVAGFENFGAEMIGAGAGPVFESGANVATNLHGPFLPMNPAWADRLLAIAAARAGIPMGDPDDRTRQADDYAARSRQEIRRRLGV